MSELPGTAAVGIESVEWLDADGGNLTVRITGRWRRRRGWVGAGSRGPTMLVVESGGRRHRFPALPEPPSLAGTPPGMWQLSFSVPAGLAPELGGNAWLAFGTLTVPLPIPESAVGRADAEPPAAPDAAPREPGVRAVDPATVGPAPEEPGARAVDPAPEEPGARAVDPAPEEPGARAAGLEIERAWRRADDAERAAAELATRMRELQDALHRERADRERIAASLADRDRVRRAAEQRAHAEEAMRHDLARRLASGERRTASAREALGDLATAEDRIRELERRLADARRAADEAEQAAAAAIAARVRAERARGEPGSHPALGEERAEAERLRLEDVLRSRRESTGARVPAEPPTAVAPPPEAAATASSRPPVQVGGPLPAGLTPSGMVAGLHRELDARASAEAGLRARLVAAETQLAARVLLQQRTTATLRELRAELDGLRETLTRERDRRRAAEAQTARLRRELGGQRERSRDAYDAIGQLRDVLGPVQGGREAPAGAGGRDAPAPGAGGGPTGSDAGPGDAAQAEAIVPDRLSDALARLREATEPREPGPGPAQPPGGATPAPGPGPAPPSGGATPAPGPGPASPPGGATPAPGAAVSSVAGVGRPTLEPAFRRLAAHDADLAGRLLLDLLPCQWVAYPHPIAYDLVLGPGRGCVQVTVGAGAAHVELQGAARTREQVDVRIVGDPGRLARLLTVGPLRRLLRFGIARVRGRRGTHRLGWRGDDGVDAIRALLALPLDLTGLRAAGMRPEPETLLALVAAMIDPAWTRGERFTLAHVDEQARTVYLQVRDGEPPRVSRTAPEGRVATEASGSATALAVALSGSQPAWERSVTVRGDSGPPALLTDWVKRAQSG